jgi:hypothetical protein
MTMMGINKTREMKTSTTRENVLRIYDQTKKQGVHSPGYGAEHE